MPFQDSARITSTSNSEAMDYDDSPIDNPDIEEDPNEKTPVRRSRNGCLTCRTRHLKCDEIKPQCTNCTKGGRTCQWGMILKFDHKKSSTSEKIWYILPIEKDYSSTIGTWRFEDESVSIASQYQGGLESYGFSESNDEFQTFSSHSSKSSTSLSIIHHQSSYGYSTPPQQHLLEAITDPFEMQSIRTYHTEIAEWLDIMNSNQFFSVKVPMIALVSPAVRWSIVACGSYQDSLNGSMGNPAQQYYNKAMIEIETSHHGIVGQENYAIACTLLNVYEMLASPEANRVYGINRTCSAFKRCGWDIMTASVILSDAAEACKSFILFSTMLCHLSMVPQIRDCEMQKYRPGPGGAPPKREPKDINWLQQLLPLIGNAGSTQDFENLHVRIHDWGQRIPSDMKPLWWVQGNNNFPFTLFVKDMAAFSYILYHMGMIMLPLTEQMEHTQAIYAIIYYSKNPGIITITLQIFRSILKQSPPHRNRERFSQLFHQLQDLESSRSKSPLPIKVPLMTNVSSPTHMNMAIPSASSHSVSSPELHTNRFYPQIYSPQSNNQQRSLNSSSQQNLLPQYMLPHQQQSNSMVPASPVHGMGVSPPMSSPQQPFSTGVSHGSNPYASGMVQQDQGYTHQIRYSGY